MINLAELIVSLDRGIIPSIKAATLEDLAAAYKEVLKIDHKNSELLLLGIEQYFADNSIKNSIKSFEDFFEIAHIFDRDENSINRFFDAAIGLRTIGNLAKFDQITQEKNNQVIKNQRVRGSFEYAHTQTHYSLLIDIFNYLRPKPGEQLLDIGSGFGRVGFFLGLCFPKLNYLGLELIEQRVDCSKKIAHLNSFSHCQFESQDLLDPNYVLPKADYYYFYDPLDMEGIEKLSNDLENQFKHNNSQFKIIALSGYDENLLEHFKSQGWLQVIRSIEDQYFKQSGLILQTVNT